MGVHTFGDGTFGVKLDQRLLKTPAMRPLLLPTISLARAVAYEWGAQKTHVDPYVMPLTSLVMRSYDLVALDRATHVETLLSYLMTDTLCNLAPSPSPLRKMQDEVWVPVIKWFEKKYDVTLKVTEGIDVSSHSMTTRRRMKVVLEDMDSLTLTGLVSAASNCKSMICAMALYEEYFSAEACTDASLLENLYQQKEWGMAEGAHDVDRSDILSDLAASHLLFTLLKK